jgi:hypothetical protein
MEERMSYSPSSYWFALGFFPGLHLNQVFYVQSALLAASFLLVACLAYS